jgi:heme ABC exporter ATP-binding subunit CcmA
MPALPAIELQNVSKLFGRFAALKQISATFDSGRLYCLVGENGAGKSTLLRVIAGLAKPSMGQVRVLGTDDLRAVTARIGYMAHASMIYDELTGAENLSYFASLYGVGDTRCEAALREVGLEHAAAKRAGEYSQGMRQRLSLARGVLNSPEVLLLDEPFSNLDAQSVSAMAQMVGAQRDAGKCVMVVTHQPAALAGLADEYVHMAGGRIVSREAALNSATRASEVRA